jgi:hypothetical protein
MGINKWINFTYESQVNFMSLKMSKVEHLRLCIFVGKTQKTTSFFCILGGKKLFFCPRYSEAVMVKNLAILTVDRCGVIFETGLPSITEG